LKNGKKKRIPTFVAIPHKILKKKKEKEVLES
jgi:hypothetical protein